MKKLCLFLMLMSGLSAFAHAGSTIPQNTYQVALGSATTVVVAISSFNALASSNQADVPTLAGRVTMEVQNLDTALNLFCNPSPGVSTTNGRKIAPGNSWIFAMSDFLKTNLASGGSAVAAHMYCVNDGTTGTTKAAVSQAY